MASASRRWLGVTSKLVKLWCQHGRFPHARMEETPQGKVWYVPESDLKDFTPPQPGKSQKTMVSQSEKASKKKGKK